MFYLLALTAGPLGIAALPAALAAGASLLASFRLSALHSNSAALTSCGWLWRGATSLPRSRGLFAVAGTCLLLRCLGMQLCLKIRMGMGGRSSGLKPGK